MFSWRYLPRLLSHAVHNAAMDSRRQPKVWGRLDGLMAASMSPQVECWHWETHNPAAWPCAAASSCQVRCCCFQLPSAPTRALAVWDFDWTMVEDNSDTWVVERLGAKPDFLRLQTVLLSGLSCAMCCDVL